MKSKRPCGKRAAGSPISAVKDRLLAIEALGDPKFGPLAEAEALAEALSAAGDTERFSAQTSAALANLLVERLESVRAVVEEVAYG